MNIGELVHYLNDNNCELIPMPEWNKANTLKVINKSNGRTASLNTKIEGDLFETTIEAICSRLGLSLPPNYASED